MQKLPIGMSEFSELRTLDRLYIDKTKYAYRLLTEEFRTFLSRPRRFGKSLFVSTLEAALQGKKELFEGLWIADSDYSWEPCGVIRLDFSLFSVHNQKNFTQDIKNALWEIGRKNTITLSKDDTLKAMLQALIIRLSERNKKKSVAILVDEYDYPILHTLHNPELAQEIRDVIKDVSTVIKGRAAEVKFVFVTGVSAFSKSGLSSGLNNLKNLTMEEDFFSICGYTDEEIDLYFAKHIQAWATLQNTPYQELRENLRLWYNGYRFVENTPTIYNPYSFTCAVDSKNIKNYWFESATPQVLLTEMKKEERRNESQLLYLEELEGTGDLLQTFEIEDLPLPAFLFQMGYLTIKSYDALSRNYQLTYPNLEVKASLQRHLVAILTQKTTTYVNPLIGKIYAFFVEGKIQELVGVLSSLISDIPYTLHVEEEKFYHALIQILFSAAGIDMQSERSTATGRMDICLRFPTILYVVELKLNKPPEIGLEQIKQKRYFEPFLNSGVPICALALSFMRKTSSKDGISHFEILYKTENLV